MIHATAIVDPRARLHSTVRVGPYVVIDAEVEVGPECVLGPHVYLTGRTVLGRNNRVYAGSVLGEAPQDLKYNDAPTGLRIGDNNVFREHVTVHRSNTPEEETQVGSNNFLMAHSHVGHNSVVTDEVILANGVLLGGHVQVGPQAFLAGHCAVHQFVRVGRLALMQGASTLSMDLPPFTVGRALNRLCGLNTIGLRRAGIPAGDRLELKRAYRILFCSSLPRQKALEQALQECTGEAARHMIDFVATTTRGVGRDTGQEGERDPEDQTDRPE